MSYHDCRVWKELFPNRDTARLPLLTFYVSKGGALPLLGNNAQRTDIAARMRLGWVCVQISHQRVKLKLR